MSNQCKYVNDARCITIELPDFENTARNVEVGLVILTEKVGNRIITLEFQKNTQDGVDFLGMYFKQSSADGDDEITAVVLENCFYVDKRIIMCSDGKPMEAKTNNWYGSARVFDVEETLEPNSGYLVNGALKIYIEIRIDCLIGKDGIRRFNFWDPVPKWLTLESRFWDSPLYTPKQPFLHHCESKFGNNVSFSADINVNGISQKTCELFLQRVNGVMLPIEDRRVFVFAQNLGANQTTRLCEPNTFGNQLPRFWYKFSNNMDLFKKTVEDIKNIEDLKKFVEDCGDVDKMTGEHLKTIVKKFFSFV